MKEQILSILKKQRDFVSGEELSNILGVSRTAVWKIMTKLKDEGYQIESVTRKGYKLIESPDILTENEIKFGLETESIGKHIIFFQEVDSTNLEIKRLVLEGAEHGTVVIADAQNKGRGRKGRSWDSPPGTGIWMSILLKPDINPNNAAMITIVAGLAVCKSIRNISGQEALIKWPNDIVINKKKICGILTEMSAEIDHLNYIILGIGINVNTDVFPEEIKEVATSIKVEGKEEVSRVRLLQEILKNLEKYYEMFVTKGDLSLMIKEYKKYCITYGSDVKITERNKTIIGKIIDITNTGELILMDELGKEQIIRSGEVSVRGMYGYV